jgi:hypothetical protein
MGKVTKIIKAGTNDVRLTVDGGEIVKIDTTTEVTTNTTTKSNGPSVMGHIGGGVMVGGGGGSTTSTTTNTTFSNKIWFHPDNETNESWITLDGKDLPFREGHSFKYLSVELLNKKGEGIKFWFHKIRNESSNEEKIRTNADFIAKNTLQSVNPLNRIMSPCVTSGMWWTLKIIAWIPIFFIIYAIVGGLLRGILGFDMGTSMFSALILTGIGIYFTPTPWKKNCEMERTDLKKQIKEFATENGFN